MNDWTDLTNGQRLETPLCHVVMQIQVQKLEFQTNESFVEE